MQANRVLVLQPRVSPNASRFTFHVSRVHPSAPLMDFGWLGVVGVLLVVAGLSALGFDALRHKRAKKPYAFPEIETTLLDDPARNYESRVQSPKSKVRNRPLWTLIFGLWTARQSKIRSRPLWTPRQTQGHALDAGPLTARKRLDRSGFYVLGAVCCSLVLVIVGVAALAS